MKLDPVVETTKELVSIPSPSGKEREVCDYVKGRLEGHADEVRIVPIEGCGPSLVAYHRGGRKEAPTVILSGHLDTVEVAEGWSTDPLEPHTDGNKLFGLGAGDMKAGLAVLIDVFQKWSKEKGLNLTLAASSDEEGNSFGAYTLIKEGLVGGDICLMTEPTNEMVMVGCRGRYVVDITVIGKAAHGARPHLGVNAIEDAARVISNLNRIKPRQHELLGRGSLCVLKVVGGGDSLSVPDRCLIRVDRHVVPGETQELVMDDVIKALRPLEIQSKLKFSWMKRPTPFLEPYITERTELVKTFMFMQREVSGSNVDNVVYGESVGDFNLFGKAMPTIVYGPAAQDWHSPNEFVLVDSIVRVRDLYMSYLKSIRA
jgi:acetylornithine deacetylase/succinyl-diaminopimelate desuccinylase-like protein